MEKALPKRLIKPKMGKNDAIRTGGGFHKSVKRVQNELQKRIRDELEYMEEERR